MALLIRKSSVLVLFVYMLSCMVKSQQHLDYFALILKWPNAYCNQGKVICREPVPQDFKITGFVPRTKKGTLPTFINSNSFRLRELKDWNFTRNLELFWPNLIVDGKNSRVWDSGWLYGGKHTDMTANNYFYTAITYAKKYINLYELLRRSDKNFPGSQSYDREKLYSRIENILGFMPRIVCNKNLNDEYQLSSVNICMNRQGEAFNCSSSQFYRCPPLDPIYFPTEQANYKNAKG